MALDSSVVADAIKGRIDAIDVAVAQDNSTALTTIADEILTAVSDQGYIPNTPESGQVILDLIQGLIDEESLSQELIDTIVTDQELTDEINNVNNRIDQELTDEINNVNNRIDQEFSNANQNYEDLRVNFDGAQQQREQADIDILLTHAKMFSTEQELIRRLRNDERLIDAVVTVDPDSGQIVNKAFQYADGRFSQAQTLIDGVDARISLAVNEIETNDNQISDLSSEIELLPGVIDQRATAIVTDAISALEPAVAFNFFDSTQGWIAVNGSLTSGSNKISVTWGDIESPTLSYVADDNPRLTIALTRLDTETTWDGTVIVTFDDASELVLNNALDPIQEQSVPTSRSIDLSGNDSYTGTVVKIRVILGTSVSDEFDIRSITVGKTQAIVQQVDNLDASVTEAFSQINANEAKIEDRVTFTYYDDNTVTLSNASTVVDGLDSIVKLQATRREINENNIITKANDAAVFIDGSEATITQITNSIQSDITGVQNDADDAYASATTALSEIDATNGRIRSAVTTIGGVQVDAEENSIQSVLLAYEQFKFDIGQAEVGVSVARAFDEIQATSDEFGAFAEQQRGVNAATQTEIGRVESEVLDTISARTGYCSIDGHPSGDGTPSQCESNGGVWVDDAPLAETIRAARITTADGQEATVGQLGSTYVTEDGELVAVGSMTTDVNGFLSGFINRNDGSQSDFDIIASNFRVGNVDTEGNYIPSLYLDTVADQLTFRGNVVLGDGYNVTSESDIRALDGNYIEFRYQASETQPATPTALEPSGWSLTPPNTVGKVWVITATKIADGTQFAAGSTWSSPSNFKSPDSQSTFKSTAFLRSNTTPATPTGGSYSSPIPTTTGWSDGIPTGEAKLWQTTRIFTDDGESPQQSSWTTPNEVATTENNIFKYSEVSQSSNPGNPDDNPSNWSDSATSSTNWLAQRKIENGDPQTWNVSLIKGEKGDNAKSLKLVSNAQSFRYDGDGEPDPSGQQISLYTQSSNLNGNPSFFADPTVTLTGTGNSRTLDIDSFGSNNYVTITVTQDGLSDEITIVRLEDGSEVISGFLSNESHNISATPNGTPISFTGASGKFRLFKGSEEVTTLASFSGDATKNELTLNVGADGSYSVSGSSWSTESESFDITASYDDTTITKQFSLSKSKQGDKGENAKILKLSSDSQAFHFDGDNNADPSNQLITFTVQESNLDGSLTISNNKTLPFGTDTSGNKTLSVADFGNNQSVTVTATKDGLSDEITVVRLVDGSENIVGYLSNENHNVSTDSLGNSYSLTNSGGKFTLFKGSSEITSGVSYTGSTTKNGLSLSIDTNGNYILSGSSWTSDSESFELSATYEGTTITKNYTISKSKQGDVGQSSFKSIVFDRSNSDLSGTPPTGGSYSKPVPSGWSDGVPSGDAKLWQSTRIFTSDGASPQQSAWTTPRQLTNTADFQVQYSSVTDITLAGDPSSDPTNWSETPSTDTFLQAQRKKENGVWGSWQVFRVKGEKGENSRSIVLSSTGQSFHFDGDGGADPSSQSIMFEAQVSNLGGNLSFSTSPTVNLTGTGNTRTLSIADFGSNQSVMVTATQDGLSDSVTVVRLVDGSDNVVGYLSNEVVVVPTDPDGTDYPMGDDPDGVDIVGSGGVFKAFKGTTDITTQCYFSVKGDRNYTTNAENSNGVWVARLDQSITDNLQFTIDTTTGEYRVITSPSADAWMTDSEWFTVQATYQGVTLEKRYIISKAKAGIQGIGGNNGDSGAGFYGNQYTSITTNQSVITSRFQSLVGRSPVLGDIFTQSTSGGEVLALQYDGSSWGNVALQVDGSIVATGTIAGDKFIAGTLISGPVIRGGKVEMIGSGFMKVQGADSFGPNNLIEWYGPKDANTWNSSGPRYANLTKANAITYLDDTGGAYFGGSIIAGTLKNASQTTTKTYSPSVSTGRYGSNGGTIEIKCSISVSSSWNDDGSCPVDPDVNPQAVLRLYRVYPNGTTEVASQVLNGDFTCFFEGSNPAGSQRFRTWSVGGSFTFTDTLNTTTDREYMLEADVTDVSYLGTNPDSSLSLSIISEEA